MQKDCMAKLGGALSTVAERNKFVRFHFFSNFTYHDVWHIPNAHGIGLKANGLVVDDDSNRRMDFCDLLRS